MIIRKVDTSHDWQFGAGLASYAVDEQAIEQNINSRLLSWVGDCFFAQNEGVDWKSRLDVGQQVALEQEVRGVIQASYGVITVKSVSASFNGSTRLITLTYEITTFFSASFQSQITLGAGG